MTPKEKAQELYQKFSDQIPANTCGDISEFIVVYERVTKKCALIAIDEVLNDDWFIPNSEDLLARKEYWEEVKQEIINL